MVHGQPPQALVGLGLAESLMLHQQAFGLLDVASFIQAVAGRLQCLVELLQAQVLRLQQAQQLMLAACRARLVRGLLQRMLTDAEPVCDRRLARLLGQFAAQGAVVVQGLAGTGDLLAALLLQDAVELRLQSMQGIQSLAADLEPGLCQLRIDPLLRAGAPGQGAQLLQGGQVIVSGGPVLLQLGGAVAQEGLEAALLAIDQRLQLMLLGIVEEPL